MKRVKQLRSSNSSIHGGSKVLKCKYAKNSMKIFSIASILFTGDVVILWWLDYYQVALIHWSELSAHNSSSSLVYALHSLCYILHSEVTRQLSTEIHAEKFNANEVANHALWMHMMNTCIVHRKFVFSLSLSEFQCDSNYTKIPSTTNYCYNFNTSAFNITIILRSAFII